jgi:hypothetical protein
LRTAQLALNEARDRGNASAERIAVLESRVADARQRVEIETSRTELAQGNYNEALGAFVTQIVPQLVTAGASGVQVFTGLAKSIKENNISFGSIGGTIKNTLSTIVNFGTGTKDIAAAAKTSGDALVGFDGSVRKTGVTLGGLKNAITGVPWGLIGLGAAGAAVALYAIGTNAFGIRTHLNNIGVEIGKQVPLLNQFLDYIGKWGDKLEISLAVMSGKFGELSQGEIKNFNTAITEALEDPILLFDELGEKVDAATGIMGSSLVKLTEPADQLVAHFAQINLSWERFQSGKLTGADDMRKTLDGLDYSIAILAERAKTEFPQFQSLLESISTGIQGKLADGVITEDEFNEVFEWLGKLGPLIQFLKEEAANTKTELVDLGPTFDAANAGADAFMANVPDNLLKTEKGLILVQAQLKQVIDGLKAAAETPQGEWITPEFIEMFEKLVNIDLTNTIKDLNDTKDTTKDLTESEKQMNETIKEQEQLYTDRRAEMAKHIQEAEELTESQNAINAAFGTNITLIGMTEQQIDRLTNISNTYVDTVQNEEDSLAKLAIQYGIVNPAILDMINNTDDNRVALSQIISTQLDYTRALTDGEVRLRLIAAGHADAAVEAAKFLETTIRNAAQADDLNDRLVTIANTMGVVLPRGMSLTNDQLREIITSQEELGTGAEVVSRILEESLAPSFDTVLQSAQKLAEGGKDAKKNANEILKGLDISKDLKGKMKDIRDDLAEDLDNMDKVIDTWNAVRVIDWEGKLSSKDFEEEAENIIGWLEKLNDPEGVAFAGLLEKAFEGTKDMSAEARQEFEQRLDPVMQELFGPDGRFVDGEITVSDLRYAIELLDKALDPLNTKLENLANVKVDEAFQNNAAEIELVLGGGTEQPKEEDAVKSLEEAKKKIETAAQAAQTALSNLAEQGSNSISILVQNLKPHVETIHTYFNETIVTAINNASIALLGFSNLLSGGGGKGKGGFQNVSDLRTERAEPGQGIGDLIGGGGNWANFGQENPQALQIGEGGGNKAGGLLAQVVLLVSALKLWIEQNNILDQTIAQIIIDTDLWVKGNNILDVTIAQLITDVGLWVKGNNVFDRTVAQIITDTGLWTRANNTLARTIVQVKTNVDALVRSNNTLARTIVQVGKNFDNAADDAENFADALQDVENQARETAAALRAMENAGGTRSAQHGMNETLEQDTLIVAHKGESVRIGRGTASQPADTKPFLQPFDIPRTPMTRRQSVMNQAVDMSGVIHALSNIQMPSVLYAYITIDMGEMGRITKLSKIQLGMWNQG